MIDVVCGSIGELLLSRISLAGELPYDKLLYYMPEVKESAMRARLSLEKRERKSITVNKVNNTIRLLDPNGLDLLQDFSEDLYKHYMTMTKGHRLGGGEKSNKINRRKANAILHAMRNGFAIDGINVRYKSQKFEKKRDHNRGCNFFGIGEMLAHVSPGENIFFTSSCVKAARNDPSQKIRLGKFTGIAITDREVYVTYYIDNIDEVVNYDAEKQIKTIAEIVAKKMIGDVSVRGLFVCDDIEGLMSKSVKKKMRPGRLFDNYIIVSDSQQGDTILKAKRKNIKNILYYEDELSDQSDGVVDGMISYELCSGNYGKIERIQKQKLQQVQIMCFEWQKEIIKNLLPKIDIEFEVVPENVLCDDAQ